MLVTKGIYVPAEHFIGNIKTERKPILLFITTYMMSPPDMKTVLVNDIDI